MGTTFRPGWWSESHSGAWDRIKEAIRRDWEQTKHDLHLKGGHELNQDIGDTLKQAAGREAIPAHDRPNPPRVIGSWDDVSEPIGYGYGARQQYGAEHPAWNDDVESKLRAEWEQGKAKAEQGWDDVKRWVRHGYEYEKKP